MYIYTYTLYMNTWMLVWIPIYIYTSYINTWMLVLIRNCCQFATIILIRAF